MAIYLGLDASTQSLSAVAIDYDRRKVVLDHSINFDERLPQFKSKGGVLPNAQPESPVAHSDPLMWLAALDLLFSEIGDKLDLSRVRAIAGSGQQHGSVYLNERASTILGSLDSERPLSEQIAPALSRRTSPIWMDQSTRRQKQEIEQALGGPGPTAELTGSRCFERFTGPQIRKFWQEGPGAYARTNRIHLVSSFMASVLNGRHAPIDHGDGAGMNLMDIRAREWSAEAIAATAPHLASKLPPLGPSDTLLGRLSPYFVERYGFSREALAIAWSGDNPCSLIGLGLISAGRVGISLGTSDTYFGYMTEPRTSPEGAEGHVFGAPTGDYMSLICFQNGSLAREVNVRDRYGLDWEGFSRRLGESPPGNRGRVLLPYFGPEITPAVPRAMVRRYGLEESDAAGNVRGVIEAQMASMALHSQWMGGKAETIYATGGGSQNRDILQVMADLHDAEVYQFEVSKSAALGAALRAAHADLKARGEEPTWPEVVADFAEPVAESRIAPNPNTVPLYREFLQVYQACEAHALRAGPDPSELQRQFAAKW
ncbi:MAG: carbohydrate kinase [Planctomycetes bacterium]|nr:carbohydrate kinase [Planctomycetota bacterium]